MFSSLGIIAVIGSWLAAAYLLTKWPDKKLPSISEHAASSRGAYGLFVITLVVLGGLFYWWLLAWFAPRLGLANGFEIVLTVAILGQAITGLVPDTKGWPKTAHRVAATSAAILYLPLSAYIILAPSISKEGRAAALILGIIMVAALSGVAFLKRSGKRFLLFQGLYILAFQMLILAAAYLS